jgi:hypothetical protein
MRRMASGMPVTQWYAHERHVVGSRTRPARAKVTGKLRPCDLGMESKKTCQGARALSKTVQTLAARRADRNEIHAGRCWTAEKNLY